jgi:hypothetical protein
MRLIVCLILAVKYLPIDEENVTFMDDMIF